MGIVSLNKNAVVRYKPSYGGNRSSKEKNPTIVGIKPMTHLAIAENTKLISEKLKEGDGSAENYTVVTQEVQKKQFIDNIDFVENGFRTDDNGDVVPIPEKDIALFYESIDDDYLKELVGAMESHTRLSEGQVKNLGGASSTTSAPESQKPQDSTVTTAPKPTE